MKHGVINKYAKLKNVCDWNHSGRCNIFTFYNTIIVCQCIGIKYFQYPWPIAVLLCMHLQYLLRSIAPIPAKSEIPHLCEMSIHFRMVHFQLQTLLNRYVAPLPVTRGVNTSVVLTRMLTIRRVGLTITWPSGPSWNHFDVERSPSTAEGLDEIATREDSWTSGEMGRFMLYAWCVLVSSLLDVGRQAIGEYYRYITEAQS